MIIYLSVDHNNKKHKNTLQLKLISTLILLKQTFFSSLVGGFLKQIMSGAYMKVKIAIPNSIHSNPIVFTNVPLNAGPTKREHLILLQKVIVV